MNALKSLVPRTQLPSYAPGQEINFELIHEGEALKANTVYLTGQLVCQVAGNVAAQKFYDNFTGIASFVENLNVKCDLFSEIITNYGRHVKMNNCGTLSPDQLCVGLKNTSELLQPMTEQTRVLIHDSANASRPASFAHKLMNCLNNMSGDLDYARSGKIQLSFKLPSVSKAFFGADVAASVLNYTWENVELHYMTVPAGSPSVSIRIAEDTQKLISTSNTTVFNTFINPIDNVLVSFAPTTCETEATQNFLVCSMPDIQKLSWVYNDQSNRLVAYEIETKEEQILSGYSVLASMGQAIDLRDKIPLPLQDAAHSISDGFLVGLALGQLMDFSRSGLGLNVQATLNVVNNVQEQLYCYMVGYGSKVLF